MPPDSENGLPLGDFLPSDRWQTHVNAIFYGTLGPAIHDHFQTYVSRDHRLAHALADTYFENRKKQAQQELRFIQEWGVGNGNLAACFLTRLREIDTEGAIYPFTHYVLCDYSEEILRGVRSNPLLNQHAGRFSTVRVDASRLDGFKPHSIDKILSNEIWDDLATRVLLKHQGSLYEEYLQPAIDPSVVAGDFDAFKARFNAKDLDALKQDPPFLAAIQWQRSFQRVDASDWPYPEALQAHLEGLQDEIPIPVNTGAFATLERAFRLLRPDGQGYTGLDYGMFSMKELNAEGRPYFNLYGGQYTFMVNFDLLARVGEAIGFQHVEKEFQHTLVGRHCNGRVQSLVEIVQHHPQVPQMAPWDRDLLMLGTLSALNGAYQSPYTRRMQYPALPGTPKKQKKQIAQAVKNLSPHGVPDTVAYVTEKEVFSVLKSLRRLGYRENDLKHAFNAAPQPIAFVALHLR